MKQFIHSSVVVTTLLLLASANGVTAAEIAGHVAPGYLSSGFGIPVKNNFGECWMSGPVSNFKPSADCMTAPEPKMSEAPKPEPIAAPVAKPVEAKQAEPAPAPVAAAPVQMSLAADALFDFDKFKLRPAGMKAIDDVLAKTMMQGGAFSIERIMVVGHTDSVGTVSYNQKLSERRANAVKAYMVSKGVQSDMIVTEGKGKLYPIATNTTAEGRQLNRRVDITFEGTEPAQK